MDRDQWDGTASAAARMDALVAQVALSRASAPTPQTLPCCSTPPQLLSPRPRCPALPLPLPTPGGLDPAPTVLHHPPPGSFAPTRRTGPLASSAPP